MSNRNYADELASAADRIGDISLPDLQIMLRRAALRLRNTSQVPLDPEWEDALRSVAGGLACISAPEPHTSGRQLRAVSVMALAKNGKG